MVGSTKKTIASNRLAPLSVASRKVSPQFEKQPAHGQDVIVLGAGVGGLSAAIALTQIGFSVRVYERHSHLSDIGAGIVCWPNASFVLESLGVLPQIQAAGGRISGMHRYDFKGDKLGELDTQLIDSCLGYPSVAIFRKDLMAILYERAINLGVDVVFDHTVSAIEATELEPEQEVKQGKKKDVKEEPSADEKLEQSTEHNKAKQKEKEKEGEQSLTDPPNNDVNEFATVFFENRQQQALPPAKASIILAADGRMHSLARRFVLSNAEPATSGSNDAQPVYSGFVNWVGRVEFDSPVFTQRAVQDYWGVGKRFGMVPISSYQAYWAAGYVEKISKNNSIAPAAAGKTVNTGIQDDLLAKFNDWPPLVRDVIAAAKPNTINKIYVHDLNPINTWHRANVLLLGDAAHAPLPTSGQGACQALEDAWFVAKCFERAGTVSTQGDVQAVFDRFTAGRKQKANGIIQAGRHIARSLFNDSPIYCKQRNAEAKRTNYQAMAQGMARSWGAGLSL